LYNLYNLDTEIINIYSENVFNQKYDFERQLYAQTQDLQIFKKFNMSQINPKECVHNTVYSTLHSRSVPLSESNCCNFPCIELVLSSLGNPENCFVFTLTVQAL